MAIITDACVDNFGIGVLTKRAMHAPYNNVDGRKKRIHTSFVYSTGTIMRCPARNAPDSRLFSEINSATVSDTSCPAGVMAEA